MPGLRGRAERAGRRLGRERSTRTRLLRQQLRTRQADPGSCRGRTSHRDLRPSPIPRRHHIRGRQDAVVHRVQRMLDIDGSAAGLATMGATTPLRAVPVARRLPSGHACRRRTASAQAEPLTGTCSVQSRRTVPSTPGRRQTILSVSVHGTVPRSLPRPGGWNTDLPDDLDGQPRSEARCGIGPQDCRSLDSRGSARRPCRGCLQPRFRTLGGLGLCERADRHLDERIV